ncbi:MAG: type VI immunity family protein [Methylococcales bacterium]
MESINPIQIKNLETGNVYLRNGVTLAFFLDQFVHECSNAVTTIFDLFVENTPPNTLKWAVVSATSEEWREVDSTVMKRLRDSLAPVGARKRKYTAFRVNDFGNEAPQFSFTLSDRDKDEKQTNSLTLVQMTFPPGVTEKENADNLCGLIAKFAALLKPVSGYCSPSLLPADSRMSAAFSEMKSIALRYPGYDVAMNDMTQLVIGPQVRGARWITLLGTILLEMLGGIHALRNALPSEVEVHDIAGIVMIRAGRMPELGDKNRKLDTPLLRAVARILEPITLFQEVDLLSYFAGFDEDLLQRWERRFLD